MSRMSREIEGGRERRGKPKGSPRKDMVSIVDRAEFVRLLNAAIAGWGDSLRVIAKKNGTNVTRLSELKRGKRSEMSPETFSAVAFVVSHGTVLGSLRDGASLDAATAAGNQAVRRFVSCVREPPPRPSAPGALAYDWDEILLDAKNGRLSKLDDLIGHGHAAKIRRRIAIVDREDLVRRWPQNRAVLIDERTIRGLRTIPFVESFHVSTRTPSGDEPVVPLGDDTYWVLVAWVGIRKQR